MFFLTIPFHWWNLENHNSIKTAAGDSSRADCRQNWTSIAKKIGDLRKSGECASKSYLLSNIKYLRKQLSDLLPLWRLTAEGNKTLSYPELCFLFSIHRCPTALKGHLSSPCHDESKTSSASDQNYWPL